MKAFGRWAAILLLAMPATAAYADGGTLILHQDAGAFTITLFAAPEPLTTGESDLSVLVQDRAGGEVLLDSVIDLTASPEDGENAPETVRLASGNATNRLLQSGQIRFTRRGGWRLHLHVRHGDQTADVETRIVVQADASRRAIVWFYVLLPVFVILLFFLHQLLERRPVTTHRRR